MLPQQAELTVRRLLYCRTDFSCCPDVWRGYSGEDNLATGQVGFSDRIGTCDWEISLYKYTFSGVYEFETILPIFTDDSKLLLGRLC